MIDAIVGTKTLIVLNFRPGLTAPWMQRSHYRQIGLAPLASEEAAELLRDMLGDDPSIALLSRNIAERARGNPFFIEELVRSLVERGDFDGERGAYRLKGGIDTIPLPVTVQAVLSARIDRLPEPARQILQTSAVIGREVPFAILEQVTGLPANELTKGSGICEIPSCCTNYRQPNRACTRFAIRSFRKSPTNRCFTNVVASSTQQSHVQWRSTTKAGWTNLQGSSPIIWSNRVRPFRPLKLTCVLQSGWAQMIRARH